MLNFRPQPNQLKTALVAAVLISIALPLKLNTIFIYLLGLTVLVTYTRSLHKKYTIPIFTCCAVLFFSAHAIHLIHSPSHGALLFEIEKKIPFVALPLLFYLALPKENAGKWKIMRYFVLGAAALALFLAIHAAYSVSSNHFHSWPFYHDYVTVFQGNAIYFSLYFLLALITTFELVIRTKKNHFLVLSALFTITLFLLASKIFVAVVVVVFTYYTFIHLNNWKHKTSLMLVLFLAGIIGYSTINQRFKEIKKTELFATESNINPATTFDGFSLRKELIHIGFSLTNREPNYNLIGIGPGITQEKLNETLLEKGFYMGENPAEKQGFYNYNFHNQYLQTFTETGWIGIICLLLLLFYPIYLVQRKNKRIAYWFTFVFAIGFLTESYLSRQMGIIPFLGFSALFISDKSVSLKLLLKRIMDILLSIFVLVFILSWLLPILAILVGIDTKSPPFFIQKRVGKNGRIFSCIKLRTMQKNEEQHTLPAQLNDQRIRPIGAFLRKYGIDELPQFLNVLAGSMSVIGPRPLMVSEEKKFNEIIPTFSKRLQMKPGISGLAQAYGHKGYVRDRAELSIRYKLDIKYSEIHSIWIDTKLILQTIKTILKPKA
jgi:lipopolysaccharide/colanic/teichoic acid biosynthesis glycosyltransferase